VHVNKTACIFESVLSSAFHMSSQTNAVSTAACR